MENGLDPFVVFAVAVLVLGVLAVALAFLRQADRERGRELRRAKLAYRDQRNERDKAEAALKAAREDGKATQLWYDVLLESTHDMVMVYKVQPDELPGCFIQVNDAACRTLGYRRERLLEMTPLDVEVSSVSSTVKRLARSEGHSEVDDDGEPKKVRLPDKDSLRKAKATVHRLQDAGSMSYKREFVTADGVEISVEVDAHLIERDGETVVLQTARDTSRILEAEKTVRETEQRFRDLFMNSPIGIALYDGDRKLLSVNRACLRMFGIPDEREFARFDVFDNPFLPSTARRAFRKGESARCEMLVDFEEVRENSMFISTRSGRAHFDILVQSLGLDADYQVKGYLAQVQDVSKRHQAESSLRRIEGQLRQSQKMEAIGTLAGGIAHDFNNILTPILGYAEISKNTVGPHDEIGEYMAEVIKASYRAKELVNQILAFSRQADYDGERKPIHVTPLIKEVLKLVAASAPEGVEISRIIKTDRDIVLADPTQVHQVVMNLCTNAVHEMRDTGGELAVRMSDFVLARRPRTEFPHLDPGRYLRVSIRDTGGGISPETLERIFEPFFTTKDRGQGTGMGLAVVHGIVNTLKGAITVDTKLGEGSTFHIILPVIENEEIQTYGVASSMPAGSESVLFVDDDEVIAKMAERMLSALGYHPVVVTDPADALRVFETTPEHFDAVITDQVMPGMTGVQLAAKLRAIRPDLPIIMCTGFSETVSPEKAQALGIQEFMMKPVVMRDLAHALRRALRPQALGSFDPDATDTA